MVTLQDKVLREFLAKWDKVLLEELDKYQADLKRIEESNSFEELKKFTYERGMV